MGGEWGGKATFVVEAMADPARDGEAVGLGELQLVKGWLGPDGELHEEVHTLATGSGTLNEATCEASGGEERLCAVFEDTADHGDTPAFWYARALEVPTCRWSTRECATTTPRPERCEDPSHQEVVQQRAWSSPIWRSR